MIKDFKKFILRGNTVDLAVAVVVGAAFGAIVKALVAKFLYGDFINAVIGFLIIAAVVFFMIIQPINKLTERAKRNKTVEEPTDKKCPECLSTIPKAATRCAFCTAKLK
jgi:large conductance mechanosensitive channel